MAIDKKSTAPMNDEEWDDMLDALRSLNMPDMVI
jgi:hypothetical protein